jgi:unsaturated chondroitin disaccharide hydrolase
MPYARYLEETNAFALAMREKLARKWPLMLTKAQGLDFIPYSVENGAWVPGPFGGICWWTNGFWPGMMWIAYRMTNEHRYQAEAVRAEEMLDDAFQRMDQLNHDIGFMWHLSSGVHYRLTQNEISLKRTRLAAELLAARFNPMGFIRAWNGDHIGWAIIDCMMNLSLLYWASDYTKDPRYRKIAMIHADTVMKHFLRADGSVEHIVVFDPETMEVLQKPRGQGYSAGSSWSRGQAWALYGFALSYIHTGKRAYLNTAVKVARYFIACVKKDWLPCCDFRQPTDVDLKDNCAGAIAACGLLELARLCESDEQDAFFRAAIFLLRAMDEHCADWGEESPAILQMCTGAYHSASSHHIPMVYGDFFFAEAISKLLGDDMRIW